MIVGTHPIVTKLAEAPWFFHLIGSRYCGVYNDLSDYDYIAECEGLLWDSRGWFKSTTDEHPEGGLKQFLQELGFKRDCSPQSYGPDQRLHDGAVWTWGDPDSKLPSVDVFPMDQKEAKRRLTFFRHLKERGDKEGGTFMLAMKQQKSWPTLWQILGRYWAFEETP